MLFALVYHEDGPASGGCLELCVVVCSYASTELVKAESTLARLHANARLLPLSNLFRPRMVNYAV